MTDIKRVLERATARRFTVELEPGRVVSGRLIYSNQCRAYVELDGKPQTRFGDGFGPFPVLVHA